MYWLHHQGDAVGEPFSLKEARRKVQCSLEDLISRNTERTTSADEDGAATVSPPPSAEWHAGFLQYLNSQHPLFSDTGRLNR